MARTRRQALTRPDVVEAALKCIARDGVEGLGVHRVAAELGIKAPSLYNHVSSQEELRVAVCVAGWSRFADRAHAALRSHGVGPGAIMAIAKAFRAFVKENPALYQVMSTVHVEQSTTEFAQVADRIFYVFSQALAPLNLSQDDFIHAIRALRAAVHGFSQLEVSGQFGMPYDIEKSFEWMINAFTHSLETRS
ncbi:MAG: TetR/AcrR family transcriptional regulator [Myxococcota bacterium]